MTDRDSPSDVLLIPGLFSPRWMMWPLRRALLNAGFEARIWDDASVFGSLESSIGRLRRRLQQISNGRASVGVVTHSFGDWLLRQVLTQADPAVPMSLVSLVPVMSSSPAARAVAPLGSIAPEVAVLSDSGRASQALQLPLAVDRLVVWASIDPWVRRVPELPGARQQIVSGTHNSIVFQPGLHRLVIGHLRRDRQGVA